MDFDQMWQKTMHPSLEDMSHSGLHPIVIKKYAPHWRTLSRSGLWPKWPKNEPLVGGLYHTTSFDQMWPTKLCPSSEDFITQRTLTKCGPRMCPSLEDFVTLQNVTKCGLNVVFLQKDCVPMQTQVVNGHEQINGILRTNSIQCCNRSSVCYILHSLQ
jgi:hypothetical protein